MRVVRLGLGQEREPAARRSPRSARGRAGRPRSSAYSSGSNSAQSPLGERKSGIPLSVRTPAPVSTTQGWRVADELGQARRLDTRRVVRLARVRDGGLPLLDRDLACASRRRTPRASRTTRPSSSGSRSPASTTSPSTRAATARSASRGSRRSRPRRTCTTPRRRASTTGSRVCTRCVDLRGARFRYEYVLERDAEADELVADGWTAHATVDARDVPADARAAVVRRGRR